MITGNRSDPKLETTASLTATTAHDRSNSKTEENHSVSTRSPTPENHTSTVIGHQKNRNSTNQ